MMAAQGSESVEFYLYAETKLKDRLGLLTFANACLYRIGENGCNLDELANDVLTSYHDTLFDMLDGNDKLFSSFPHALDDKTTEFFEQKLGEIDDQLMEGRMNEGQYMEAMKQLQQDRLDAIKQGRMQWMNEICSAANNESDEKEQTVAPAGEILEPAQVAPEPVNEMPQVRMEELGEQSMEEPEEEEEEHCEGSSFLAYVRTLYRRQPLGF